MAARPLTSCATPIPRALSPAFSGSPLGPLLFRNNPSLHPHLASSREGDDAEALLSLGQHRVGRRHVVWPRLAARAGREVGVAAQGVKEQVVAVGGGGARGVGQGACGGARGQVPVRCSGRVLKDEGTLLPHLRTGFDIRSQNLILKCLQCSQKPGYTSRPNPGVAAQGVEQVVAAGGGEERGGGQGACAAGVPEVSHTHVRVHGSHTSLDCKSTHTQRGLVGRARSRCDSLTHTISPGWSGGFFHHSLELPGLKKPPLP